MKGTTPKKGRPTPTAPQNRPKQVVKVDDTQPPKLSPAAEVLKAASERWRAYRRATRPFRRAFGGEIRTVMRMDLAAKRSLARDAERVMPLMEAGHTIGRVASLTGVRQGRIRLILKHAGGAR